MSPNLKPSSTGTTPSFPTWQHKVVKTYVGADGTKVTIEAGLHYLTGNSRPYFSVTGEVRYQNTDKRGRRYYRRNADCCGCCHEEIAKAVKGSGDEQMWRDLIALHLADDQGKPMHAVANGLYHLGLGSTYAKEEGMNDKAVKSHFRFDDSALGLLKGVLATKNSDDERETHVHRMCARLALDTWPAEAARGVEALKRLAGGL